MAKHRAETRPLHIVVSQEYFRVKNRWLWWWKPALKKGVKNVFGK